MSQKLPKKLIYAVLVLRTDGEHIQVLESDDYDKCYEKWKTVLQEWKDAAKELRPFEIIDPIVTAFSPSMIFEVRLIPVGTEDSNNSHNPYNKKMNEQGFSRTFPSQGKDLL